MRRESSGAGAHEKSHKRERARSADRTGEENKRYLCSPAHPAPVLLPLPHSQPSSRARTGTAHTRKQELLLDPKLSSARPRALRGAQAKDHRMATMFARPVLAALLLPAFLLSAAGAADSKGTAPVTFFPLPFLVAVACCIPRVRSCARSPLIQSVLGLASSVCWTSAWIWAFWMRSSGWDLAGAVG